MWTKYFNMVKVRRGRLITPRHGELDFSRDDIPVETCKELFEEDFPYLEITEEGKRVLYGIGLQVPTSTASRLVGNFMSKESAEELFEAFDPIFELLPPAEENPDELKTSIPIRPDIPVSEPTDSRNKLIPKRKRHSSGNG